MTYRVFNGGGVFQGPAMPHFSSFIQLRLPITTALTGAYVFGGNKALSLRNRANAALPLIQVGAPTFAPLFGANVQHENCFDTLLTPSTDRTWIVIAKPQNIAASTPADKAPLIGNHRYVSSNLRGDQMWMGTGAFYNQADRNGTTSANVALGIGARDTTKWAAFVGIVDDAGVVDCATRQLGARIWANPIGSITGRATYNGYNLRIGGDGTGTPGIYGHTAEIGMVLIHEAALTRTEVDQQLDYINGWLTTNYGITDLAA